MRRAFTVLTFPVLLLSAWDCVAPARVNLQLRSRLRARNRVAPDTGWDRYYAELIPHLPPGQPVGLVQVTTPGTPAHERQYYFLQYALAPRLLTHGTGEEFVIVHAPSAAAPSLIDVTKFTVVRSFDDDFALYRRIHP